MSASAPLPAAGARSFTGWLTKLCKGLAVVLFLGHILIQLFPSAATYLTLTPSRPVIVSVVGLLFGRLLDPLWGAKELLKFIFIVNLSTSVYTPLSGFYGVLSGFLVGIKQSLPDQELNPFVLKIKAKWIPSLVAFISIAVSFFLKESMSYLPIIPFGIYMSLDLPAILPKEARSRPKRGPK